MKIDSIRKFENSCKSIFGYSNLLTLSNFPQKIRFDLSGELQGVERVNTAIRRATEIQRNVFDGKKVWIKITIWNKKEEKILVNFLETVEIYFKKDKKTSVTLYIYIDHYDQFIFDFFLKSVIGFELGFDYGLNITCLYYCFDAPRILNVFDDRGMDVVLMNEIEEEKLRAKFSNLINRYDET